MIESIPVFKFALREDLKGEKQFLPSRSEPKATGFDVRAAQLDRKPIIMKPFQHIKLDLGFRAFCQDGWWFELKPRSSTFAKKNLHCLYGTIDETYEGSVMLACQYIPYFTGKEVKEPTLTIEFGEAIGQIIPVKRKEMHVEEVSNEEYNRLCKDRSGMRGTGGFGSSGK